MELPITFKLILIDQMIYNCYFVTHPPSAVPSSSHNLLIRIFRFRVRLQLNAAYQGYLIYLVLVETCSGW